MSDKQALRDAVIAAFRSDSALATMANGSMSTLAVNAVDAILAHPDVVLRALGGEPSRHRLASGSRSVVSPHSATALPTATRSELPKPTERNTDR